MYYFIAPAVLLNLLFFATSIFGYPNIIFDNNYAIFRPTDNGVGFDLDNHAEILFLKKLEEPSLESSPFGLRITHNNTKRGHRIHFTVYKEGVDIKQESNDVDNVLRLRNMMLSWYTSGVPNIRVSMKDDGFRKTAFSWEDNRENDTPFNITYIAFKTSSSLNIRQTDSFLWISDVLTTCPLQNAEISCQMNINRPRLASADERNSTSMKGLRKVMEMNFISKHPNPQHNYEVAIGVNQTSDKMEPRLHIIQNNFTKLKTDAIIGPVRINVNMSGGNIALFQRNDSIPFLLWKDPVDKPTRAFQDIKYLTVQVHEGAMSRSFNVENPPNACKLTCKSKEDMMPWYKRWTHKLKNAFSRDDSGESES